MTASGSNALIGFYLADLALNGHPVDARVVGNLNATLDFAALLFAIPFGALIDRYSPRLILIFGTIVGAIATQLFGLTGVIAIFFVSRALEGIASSATQPSVLSHLTDATQPKPELRGKVMSWFELSLFAGLAVGNLISGALWDSLNTGAFSVLAVCYVLAAGAFLWGTGIAARVERMRSTAADAVAGVVESLRHPLLARLAFPWLAFNSVAGLWISQFAFQLSGPAREGQWLVGRFTATEVSYFLFIYTVAFAIGVWWFGLQIGRMPRVRIMRYAFYAMYGTSLCFLLINEIAPLTTLIVPIMIVPYMIAVGIQGGLPPSALSYLADVAGAGTNRGSAMGFYTLLLSLGNISGSLLGGILANRFALNGLIAATVVFATLGLLALRLLPEKDMAVTPETSREPSLTH